MARIVFVHGSVENGDVAWAAQAPLAERHELVVLQRPGFGPDDPIAPMRYDDHGAWVAAQLRDGDHLVGHSAGALVALLAATDTGADLASVCLLEPPAFAVAAGDPDVDDLVRRLRSVWSDGPSDPRAFMGAFFGELMGGAPELPDPLPPATQRGAQLLQLEQGPWEVDVPLERLNGRARRIDVVTGGWSAPFNVVATNLVDRLGSSSDVLPGAGHNIQLAPGFNEHLEALVSTST